MRSSSSSGHRSLSRVRGVPPGARGADIATELQYLVRSAEPAVVFSSLAHLCVRAFSDVCTIDIVEQGDIAYRIDHRRRGLHPLDTATGTIAGWSVSTPFTHHATGSADPDYVGVITHRWRSRRPTVVDRDRAAALARHGVATVAEERHRSDPSRSQDAVELFAAAGGDPVSAATLRSLGCGGLRTGPSR